MGENEQGGMLRVVVVLGIIALIAGASIASINVLKGQMKSHSEAVTQKIDAAQPIDLNSYEQKFKDMGYGYYSGDNEAWVRLYSNNAPAHDGSAVLYTKGNDWIARAVHSDNGTFRITDQGHDLGGYGNDYGQGWDVVNNRFYDQIYNYSTGQKAPSNVYWDDTSSTYKIRK